MGMKFLRAVALASLSAFTMTAFVGHTPTFAAEKDKEKAEGPKISRAFSKPLQEANKALQVKDWAAALTALKGAEALTGATDYETWVTHYYMALAYYNSGDKKSAADAIVKAVDAKDVPEQNHQEALGLAMSIVSETLEPAKVIEFAKAHLPADAKLSEGVAHNLAYAYYQVNDYKTSKEYELKALDAAKAVGKTPIRSEYKLLQVNQSQLKDTAGVIETGAILASLYNSTEDWGQYIDLQTGMIGTKGAKNKNLATAALYLYKLRVVVNADSKEVDYQDAADLALSQNLPNDAVTALEAGIKNGAVTSAKAKATLAKAKKAVSVDLPTLTPAEKAAEKSPKADPNISVAAGYLSYAKFDDAERVSDRAIAKGGPRVNEAYLVKGVAEALQGKPTAADTLGKVKGDQVLEIAARSWIVYATRKTTAPAAQ
ncbi:MAG: hypothetical protein WCD42_04515 [Rhizomicrobium sp.]